jgi:hypothetical protein
MLLLKVSMHKTYSGIEMEIHFQPFSVQWSGVRLEIFAFLMIPTIFGRKGRFSAGV